jgi:hypothetical protein
MWRGNQDAEGMRPPSKKRNFQGAIHQIEGEEEQRGDSFQAIAEFTDEQWTIMQKDESSNQQEVQSI